MPRETWSDAIEQACFDTWLDEVDVPQREKEVDAFAERWGGFDPEALLRMLQKGNETEQLFAIFALGHLAPPDGEALLLPLLHAPSCKKRWASAIALGRWKDARAFPILQDLLLEDIAQHLPQDRLLIQRVYHAFEEAKSYGTWKQKVQEFLLEDRAHDSSLRKNGLDRFADASEKASQYFRQRTWEHLADPATVDAWNQQQAIQEEYRWYLIHRLTITRLFGTWRDPRAIPTLRQTLRVCQELEQEFGLVNVSYDDFTWSFFKNLLTETLTLLEENA